MRRAGPKSSAEYKNSRKEPSNINSVPLIISIPKRPKFPNPVKIENCVAPTFGFVTSIHIAKKAEK